MWVDGDRDVKPEGSNQGGGSFINHKDIGCNVEFVAKNGEVLVKALKDIEKGEEMYAKYGQKNAECLKVAMGTMRFIMSKDCDGRPSTKCVPTPLTK